VPCAGSDLAALPSADFFNGHNWLAGQLRKSGIDHRVVDNAFSHIADLRGQSRPISQHVCTWITSTAVCVVDRGHFAHNPVDVLVGYCRCSPPRPSWVLEGGPCLLTIGRSRRGELGALRHSRQYSGHANDRRKQPASKTSPVDAGEKTKPDCRDGLQGRDSAPSPPILMALYTGMRRGEILGHRWRDLDLDSCRLTVHQALEQTRASGVHFKTPKTARSRRTITIAKILVNVLAQHRKQTDERRRLFGADYSDDDLVIALPNGPPWPPDRFTDAYVAFTRKIGARGVRFHDLRHTHASQFLREGIPVKTVAQRLGHANPAVTLSSARDDR
jgi:Phage integrase family